MPTMYEIYDRHADRYDELVRAEDADGKFRAFMAEIVPQGAAVVEFGTGTGRVTSIYAEKAGSILCRDRSAHMLARARENLSPWSEKIRFVEADNLDEFPEGGLFDVAIEGWAFGHTVIDRADALEETVDTLVSRLLSALKPGGVAVIVETLGTNAASPGAPDPRLAAFYGRLEGKHGFGRTVIATDYLFPDAETARRVMGFFFGPTMEASVKTGRVPEFSGAWTRRA